MCTKKLYKFLEMKDFDIFLLQTEREIREMNFSTFSDLCVCVCVSVLLIMLCVCELRECTLKYWKTNISTARYNVYLSLYTFFFSSSVSLSLFAKLNRFDIRIRIFYHIQYHFLSLFVCLSVSVL